MKYPMNGTKQKRFQPSVEDYDTENDWEGRSSFFNQSCQSAAKTNQTILKTPSKSSSHHSYKTTTISGSLPNGRDSTSSKEEPGITDVLSQNQLGPIPTSQLVYGFWLQIRREAAALNNHQNLCHRIGILKNKKYRLHLRVPRSMNSLYDKTRINRMHIRKHQYRKRRTMNRQCATLRIVLIHTARDHHIRKGKPFTKRNPRLRKCLQTQTSPLQARSQTVTPGKFTHFRAMPWSTNSATTVDCCGARRNTTYVGSKAMFRSQTPQGFADAGSHASITSQKRSIPVTSAAIQHLHCALSCIKEET